MQASRQLRRAGGTLLALVLAAALWLPALHLFYRPRVADYVSGSGMPPKARALAAGQMRLWLDPALREKQIARMRGRNAEWDFMARTFFVLSLANMALRDNALRPDCLRVMDIIIGETIRLEKEHGIYYFLLPYARDGRFLSSGRRSLFEDGEIALMLAARRLVEEQAEYGPPMRERVDAMLAAMRESPVLSGESYPDECWMFCNAIALVVMRMQDALDGTDTGEFRRTWLDTARRDLTDPNNGMLFSCYSFAGAPLDGPEGSTIWMVAHCLQAVDPAYATDQYKRARKELARNVLGFGYAVEWPRKLMGSFNGLPVYREGEQDVDSGPIVPVLDISAGSSGMAIIAASAFGDGDYLSSLLASLNYGAFPVERKGELRYCAGNQLADAALLYAMTLGPLWKELDARAAAVTRRKGGTRP